jgi:hypothetical protein
MFLIGMVDQCFISVTSTDEELNMQIDIFRSVTVPYECLDTRTAKYDTVRIHEEVYGRKQEGSVLLKSASGYGYAKILLLFKVYIGDQQHNVAFIQNYSPVPPENYRDDDHAIGFPVLILESAGTQFTSPSTFVRAVFAVTTDDLRPNHYFVNDVLDNDIFLRLNH